jgi:hypothetical protein
MWDTNSAHDHGQTHSHTHPHTHTPTHPHTHKATDACFDVGCKKKTNKPNKFLSWLHQLQAYLVIPLIFSPNMTLLISASWIGIKSVTIQQANEINNKRLIKKHLCQQYFYPINNWTTLFLAIHVLPHTLNKEKMKRNAISAYGGSSPSRKFIHCKK